MFMDDITDEMDAAFTDEFVVTEGAYFVGPQLMIEWTPHISFEKTLNIVARVSNRVFVGLPLCMTSLGDHAYSF